ncbi:unnamed protein product [Anisakis simplex]|uniref:Uncharacterized protein n=1 Tax=Anisakis simplex TaxID=6269 RepID=A0A0M3JKG8_ANISI|nr:unnamed protein product [Anisakis simplex]
MDESDGVLSDSEADNEQTQRERSEGAAQGSNFLCCNSSGCDGY